MLPLSPHLHHILCFIYLMRCSCLPDNNHNQELMLATEALKHPPPKETSRQSSGEPLILLPEADIAIYPDRIVLSSKRKQNSLSAVQTNISVHDAQSTDRTVFFKSDLAFKIDQARHKVALIGITSERVEFQFCVQKASQLIIVQELLRRKLCELGFQEKFKVIRQLGKGATAKVFLVERITDKRLFAAKVISIKEASNKDYDTFTNETKIIKSLKNPHILAIESLYISKKELVCVIQYLEGGTLLDQLKNDVIHTYRQKFKAISDIAQGLEHLRQKRIAHRDLKLQNIMVRINKDKSKDYVIVDFGLACWIGEKELLYEKCGTPGYIAPEILRAPKGKVIVSHNSDVFSFGVICHFIMLLKAVFPYNGNPKELLQLNKKATYSLQTKQHLCLLASQYDILKKTLEIDPEKRIFSDQLKHLIRDYERQLILDENRCRRILSGQPKQVKEQKREEKKQEKKEVNKRNRIHLSNSIEMIEKKVPSMEKQHFSNRIKTEQPKSVKKQQVRENSVGKFFGKVWNKISHSNTEVMKKKDGDRKKQMKDFII